MTEYVIYILYVRRLRQAGRDDDDAVDFLIRKLLIAAGQYLCERVALRTVPKLVYSCTS